MRASGSAILFAAATAIGLFVTSVYVFPKPTTWLLLGSMPWLLLLLTMFHFWAPRGGSGDGEGANVPGWMGIAEGPAGRWGLRDLRTGIDSGQVHGTLVLRSPDESGACRYLPVRLRLNAGTRRVALVGRVRSQGDRVVGAEASFVPADADCGVIRFAVRRGVDGTIRWHEVGARICGWQWVLSDDLWTEFIVDGAGRPARTAAVVRAWPGGLGVA